MNKEEYYNGKQSHSVSRNLNKITLNFNNKDIEDKFRASYFRKSLIAFRISFITVITLYSIFGYLDYTTSYDFYKVFFAIRFLIVLPVLGSVFLFSFFKYFQKVWQGLLSICVFVGGIGIVYMLLKNPVNIYYYGGMFLIFMAGYFFIKLRFISAIIPSILIIVFYNIGALLFQNIYDIHYEYLFTTNIFYISANIIGMFALYNIEFLERVDFYQSILISDNQTEIKLINQGLEAQIEERTRLLDQRNKTLTAEINYGKQIEQKLIYAKNKATESDRLKSAFLANMSHEIRTPMNGILGFTSLLQEPNLTGEEQQKYIEIIQKSGDRMLNTVNDIIDISKIEAGQMTVSISEVNIREQLVNTYSFFKPETEKKGIQISLKNEFSEQDIIVQTDREKLNSILINLVKNAVKYSDKGSIELGVKLESDNKTTVLEFYVKDTGIGIQKDRQQAIFERFIQADIEDRNARQGSGLGLAISKAYAEMLGGKIWLESEEGIGSTFYFTIPYQAKTFENTKDKKEEISTFVQNQVRNLKVLIAEDDLPSEMLLSIAVKPFASKIYKTTTGTETVDVCRNNPEIDLVLMDIQMPGLNGYDATRQIREFNKKVIIIAQTAFAMAGDKEKSLEAGCNDYISKPIKEDNLMSLIGKYFMK